MEYRQLGTSGLMVPELCFGTGTFGGRTEFFKGLGASDDLADARKMVDVCVEAGITMFDTADVYSAGQSEEMLGRAIGHLNREDVILSTKAAGIAGEGPNDIGTSRFHLIRSVERSLARLGTDYIDLYHMHEFDAVTPVEETLRALDDLVRAGKIRYVACSNFTGWQLMKSLALSDRNGWSRYVSHQVYYSMVGREYEWELMPLALDQGVGAMVWSPLGWGRLTGKIRRETGIPTESRLNTKLVIDNGPQVPEEYLYSVVEAIDEIASEAGKTVPQIALNWLLRRPTVSTVIVGARNETQLRQNLGAVGWQLTDEQVARLDAASERPKSYPAWKQAKYRRNPPPV